MMRKLKFLTAVACTLLVAATVSAQGDDAAQLAKALKSSDAQVRIAACQKLGQMGPQAKAAVSQLITALDARGDAELQRSAALALAAIGESAEAAVPVLIKKLQSDNPKVRAYCAYALGRIGPAARDAAVPLVEIFTDKDPMVRRAVRDALRGIDAPKELTLPHMVQMLNTASPGDAMAAVMTLTEVGEAAVPGLCEALEHEDACYWACLAISELGPVAKAAVPGLVKVLEHEHPEIRMQALVALAEIGEAAKPVAAKVSEILADDDEAEGVQYAAAYALGKIGDKATALEALTDSLNSEDEFLRVAGAWAVLRLEDVEPAILKRAIDNIVAGIAADNPDVRVAAARAFADPDVPQDLVGPAFAKAMEGLEASDPAKLVPVVDALSVLGTKIVPACIKSLEEKRKLRFYAMGVLIRIGPDAAPAVPALMMTLDDSEATLRREALFALGAVGPAAAKATSKIVEKLTDDNQDVQHAACYALGNIGPDAQAALPALGAALNSSDDFQRLAAIWASLKISPQDIALQKKAVPYLAKGLSNEREHVRIESAYLLGEIGAAAQGAVSSLQNALNDQSPAVRAAVKEALEALK